MRLRMKSMIVYLWFIVCASMLPALTAPAYANNSSPPKIDFTKEERAYIEKTTSIKMCVDPDWIPFESINDKSEHEGIAADLIQIVAQRVGLKIELYAVKTWEESLAASKAKQCQIMSFLNKTPAREQWLIFTDPIFFDPNIIVTREEHSFIEDLKIIQNESVALPRGTMVEERIRHDYPNLGVILTNTESEAMTLVSEKKASMTVRSLIIAAYAIKKEGLFNLKISGKIPEYTNQLRIGIIKDEEILRNILDKGVKTITPQEREAISNRNVSINIQQGVDYSLVFKGLIGGFLVLVVVFYWNRKLSALNKKLAQLSITDKLTGLFNRIKIDASFQDQIAYSERSGKLFSVILLDIDHFKMVNDTYGHQTGDIILSEVANILKAHTKKTDIVGRWGGEEFIIIFSEVNSNQALSLAENLRKALQAHDFPITKSQTASFGVTTYQKGDQTKDILARADAALYLAKNNGRNRVKFQ